MKQTICILIIIISVIAISCNKTKNKLNVRETKDTIYTNDLIYQKDSTIDKKNEDKIYKLILEIPEVKERGNYIEMKSNGKRHLQLMIAETPKENKSNYYWIKVGEDNGTNFVTHYNFYIYTSNFEIKYFDTINDTIVSLDIWRKKIKNAL